MHQPVLFGEGHADGHRSAVPSGVPVISPESASILIHAGFCVSANFRGSIFQKLVPGFRPRLDPVREVADGTDGLHLITVRLAGRGRVIGVL